VTTEFLDSMSCSQIYSYFLLRSVPRSPVSVEWIMVVWVMQGRLLLISNYSKHIYWIFGKCLSHTEAYLRASAGSLGLIGPAEVSSSQPTKDRGQRLAQMWKSTSLGLCSHSCYDRITGLINRHLKL